MFYSASNRIADSRRSMGWGWRYASPLLTPTAEKSLCRIICRRVRFLLFQYRLGRSNCMNKPLILVEDDMPIRNLITTTLKAHGYRSITALNGETAILEASSHNSDIMLA